MPHSDSSALECHHELSFAGTKRFFGPADIVYIGGGTKPGKDLPLFIFERYHSPKMPPILPYFFMPQPHLDFIGFARTNRFFASCNDLLTILGMNRLRPFEGLRPFL